MDELLNMICKNITNKKQCLALCSIPFMRPFYQEQILLKFCVKGLFLQSVENYSLTRYLQQNTEIDKRQKQKDHNLRFCDLSLLPSCESKNRKDLMPEIDYCRTPCNSDNACDDIYWLKLYLAIECKCPAISLPCNHVL